MVFETRVPSGFVHEADDDTIGLIYGRRRALELLGGAGAAFVLSACGGSGESRIDLAELAATNATLPAGCVVRPALTEGPIFVDDQANRSDIRADMATGVMAEGMPLALTFDVSALATGACNPLEGAQVDLWQCDAYGVYSDTDFEDMGTVGQTFLRGHQFTNSSGRCAFTTIYPGWYGGRAVHVHVKVRVAGGFEFASQLFFDSALTDEVFASAPYNSRGERSVRNADDDFVTESGDLMTLDVQPADDGYHATFAITLDMT